MMKRVLLLLLILMNLVDFLVTREVIATFGIDNEKNPLMWLMIEYCGIYGILIFKSFILIFMMLVIKHLKTSWLLVPVGAYAVLVTYQLANVHHLDWVLW
jgi:hypothetical protein